MDLKLGIYMAIPAIMGVWVGADIQEAIRRNFGEAGSSLYVSFAFVIVLSIVGTWVLWDAVQHRQGNDREPVASRLAQWVQGIIIPGTMIHFQTAKIRVSLLFIVPVGFATGLLAATIAVGGFVGVPGMIYILGVSSVIASATELVVAFFIGFVGTLKYAMDGYVDIRLALIILAGSLFGVHLGAMGTTYVKPHMIKVVMGVIMLIVSVSRAIMLPVYFSQVKGSLLNPTLAETLKYSSFSFCSWHW